jgi:hypothetical protein
VVVIAVSLVVGTSTAAGFAESVGVGDGEAFAIPTTAITTRITPIIKPFFGFFSPDVSISSPDD